jgi:exopolyphosphatase/pppGpp-phosphohydrolase
LPFSARERLIVGNIARYHRKSLPKDSHAPFAELNDRDRELVTELAALLRVADGLDVTHTGAVHEIRCSIHPNRVAIGCTASTPIPDERESAKKKSDLFEAVFRRRVVIE